MKKFLAAILCLTMMVALCAAFPLTASAAGTTYLTLAHNMAEDHAINVALVAWAEAVDEATDGAIVIDVMPCPVARSALKPTVSARFRPVSWR